MTIRFVMLRSETPIALLSERMFPGSLRQDICGAMQVSVETGATRPLRSQPKIDSVK